MNEIFLSNAHEKIKNNLAYSGTTLEIFLTCTNITDHQHVRFNKSREPKHTTGAFWTTIGLEGAAHWAILRGVELKHTPLIMECNIGSQDIGPIPQNQEIPVTRIPIVVPPWRDVRRVMPSRLGGIAISSESGIYGYLKKKYL